MTTEIEVITDAGMLAIAGGVSQSVEATSTIATAAKQGRQEEVVTARVSVFARAPHWISTAVLREFLDSYCSTHDSCWGSVQQSPLLDLDLH